MDKQAFKQRMQNLKSYRENNPGKGYWDWRNSLPDNLKYTDDTEYNMRGAYESGAQPILENDGFYHLPTRNPQTGEILKTSLHPTFWKGLAEDAMNQELLRIINMLQYPQYPIPSYKYGGIHIKKKNRGKFTKSAKAAGQSVQEHAHSVMNNPKASTLQRRRANFAIQAKKWAKKRKKK